MPPDVITSYLKCVLNCCKFPSSHKSQYVILTWNISRKALNSVNGRHFPTVPPCNHSICIVVVAITEYVLRIYLGMWRSGMWRLLGGMCRIECSSGGDTGCTVCDGDKTVWFIR